METKDGRSAAVAASGQSAKPEPSCTVSAQGATVPNAGKPDFGKLRAERDASIERVAREMWEQLGGDPSEAPMFHCRDHQAACYCACPDGPCEHEFGGWREFDDGLGGEQFCQRCGAGIASHDMRFMP